MRLPWAGDGGGRDEGRPAAPAPPRGAPGRVPRPGRGVAGRMALAGLLVVVGTGATAFTVAREEAGIATDILVRGGAVDREARKALDAPLPGGPRTILLIGDDRRFGDEGPTRSDTMILVRLDAEARAITTMALPRDLRVDIPGVGKERLNAAFAEGGSRKAIATIKELLDLRINHYASVRFGAFSRAVNRLNCFYVDVDRRYFNDNSPPVGGGERYAAIDQGAGYQRLCGQDALGFVRFRHLDNDLVRADRQQLFLAEARGQVGARQIVGDRRGLLSAVASYLKTDLGSEDDEILSVLRLAVDTLGKPLVEVPFPGRVSGDYVTVDEDDLDDARDEFLRPATQASDSDGRASGSGGSSGSGGGSGGDGANGSDGSSGSRAAGGSSRPSARTVRARTPKTLTRERRQQFATGAAIQARAGGLPVYVPELQFRYGGLPAAMSRAYRIARPGGEGRGYRAYRYVVWTGIDGQYYGVQGTEWRNLPLLREGGERERFGGRTFTVQYAGRRIRRLVWTTPQGVYWVTNTLSLTLTNREMRALARSVVRAPRTKPSGVDGASLDVGNPRSTGLLPSINARDVLPAPGGLSAGSLGTRPGVLRAGDPIYEDGGDGEDDDATGTGTGTGTGGGAVAPAAPYTPPAPAAPAPAAPAPAAPAAPVVPEADTGSGTSGATGTADGTGAAGAGTGGAAATP